MTHSALARLLRHEAAGGVLLVMAALLAFIVANSALRPGYEGLLSTPLSILYGETGLSKPLVLWINDGLMAVFFFLVGLELKREMLEGKLRHMRDVVLPGIAAAGGMAVPALVYLGLNAGRPETIGGWAIPAATDIAFAIGVLALLGKGVPGALKIFLLTVAILDDLGAILIIALFYTAELKVAYLAGAILPLLGLFFLNLRATHRIAPFVILGVILWVLVLKSGVHATLAGVICAFFVPLKDRFGKSPLHAIEHGIAPWVTFLILPLFAFANAGVVLDGVTWADLASPLALGIAGGLSLGKQAGVFGATWVAVQLGAGRLPDHVGWAQIYGVACLAGIGFTMSLFIGSLSFADPALMNEVRLGVLTGSILSAVIGYIVLRLASGRRN